MTANMLNKKNKVNQNCHPEFSSGSFKRFRNEFGMTQERGRSMVEMLGVLAVIGVLSIAGIAGYTTAMNNYHANETVNQARLLASIVSIQRLLNANGGDLSDDDLKGKFTFDPATTDSIKLTATGLDSKVADRIKAMDLKIATVADGENGNLVFTFKNDMSEGGGGGQQDSDPACANVTCNEGETCDDGRCVKPADENGCSKNSDCNTWCDNNNYDKCYCAISSSPNYDDDNCYPSFTGTCAKVETKSGISGGYVVSNGGMTWWSAVNFCKAAKTGGKLVSLSDLGITGGYEGEAYCSESGCTGANWSDLKSKLGYDHYWVTDAVSCTDPLYYVACTSGSNNNSCFAFLVTPDDSFVSNGARSDDYNALCE